MEPFLDNVTSLSLELDLKENLPILKVPFYRTPTNNWLLLVILCFFNMKLFKTKHFLLDALFIKKIYAKCLFILNKSICDLQ